MSEYVPDDDQVRAVWRDAMTETSEYFDALSPVEADRRFNAWLQARDARIAREAAEREQMAVRLRDCLRVLWIVANRTEGGLRLSTRELIEVPDDLVLTIEDDIGSFDKVIRAGSIRADRIEQGGRYE